jgi:chromosome partitioning protein
MTHIYAVVNWKGGVGKTTTATNLAHGLAMLLSKNGGGRVLLIDMDPQGNVTKSLGNRMPNKTVGDFLLGDCTDPREVIVSANRVGDGTAEFGEIRRPGLYVMPCDNTFAEAKEELKNRATRGRKLIPVKDFIVNAFDAFPGLLEQFAYVIVDCPPALDWFADSIYNFVEDVIMPVEGKYLASVGAVLQAEDIIGAKESGIDVGIKWVIPTKYSGRQIMSKRVTEDLGKAFTNAVICDPVPDLVAVDHAQSMNLTVFEFDAKSPVSIAYGKLAMRVYDER